jgi:cytidylate kinase
MTTNLVITIDGTAGSGKSTAARKLAARLQIAYLDTGAMYRALALQAIRTGLDLTDADALYDMARAVHIEVDCGPTYQRIRLNGKDVSEHIRSMQVANCTGAIAGNQHIRRLLVELQRRVGRQLGAFVTEGRDQGSVVFPDADVKFVLDARVETRAERRYHDLCADGDNVTVQQVLENLQKRDAADAPQWAPLLTGERAIQIDTSDLSIVEVIDLLEARTRERVPLSASNSAC